MRDRDLIVLIAVALAVGAGCASIQKTVFADKPVAVLRGKPFATYAVAATHVTAAGLHVELQTKCVVVVVTHWCKVSEPQCRREPVIRSSEDAACPTNLADPEVSVRTPWGAVQRATAPGNSANLAIDWKASGVDPLADASVAGIASGWSIGFGAAGDEASFELSADDLTAARVAIGDATDTQYQTGAATDEAVLVAQVVEPDALAVGGAGTLRVIVSNRGPQPAYRVVANTRSSIEALHGIQLSFGRIDVGATKVREQLIRIPATADDKTALVVVDVRGQNGATANASHRYTLTAAKASATAMIDVSCALGTAEAAPGDRVHVGCTVKNIGGQRATAVAYVLSIGTARAPTNGPAVIEAGASRSVDLVGKVPATAEVGSDLQVNVAIVGSDLRPSTRSMKLHIVASDVTASGICAQTLTRDQYSAKRKKLQSALQAGALTQDDFDKYDTQMVACIVVDPTPKR